ncbi:hypothetical protein ACH4HG_10145 [Streptomyces coeruleorubidus]|uniref:Amidase n=1 Tax=Streptomyces coeruleorubidus TaxID=116188 RepID=A0ABZ0KDI5_STRC4|nr:hypothetical protein [Streptomyces coeruleorubidus]WOT36043.1 hypothetical protein R5U08_18790 [Streptomyces coeruleorubidus]
MRGKPKRIPGTAPAGPRLPRSLRTNLIRPREDDRRPSSGYAEGCATAILRVLEQRGVSVSDEIDGFLTTRTDVKALTDWLDLALTVTDAKDLFTSRPEGSQAPEE